MRTVVAFVVLVLALSCGARQTQGNYVFPNAEFLYWCVAEKGVWPVYIEEPVECETEVSRGFWDHYPIVVAADDALVQEVAEAVLSFNQQVGFELFVFDPIMQRTPDILAMVGGGHPLAAAEAKHFNLDGRHHGAIIVYNGVENWDASDIMVHELGHLVGLRHDDNNMSIMATLNRSKAAILEAVDVKAIRWVYLR